MNQARWLQDWRTQKFRDVLSRWERTQLSAPEAGEILGCSERQFRRYRARYEGDGLEGLIDRRLGHACRQLGMHVRHAAGPAAQGTQACRHRRHRGRQPVHPRGLPAGAQIGSNSGSPGMRLSYAAPAAACE
jgi:hypothetical protein